MSGKPSGDALPRPVACRRPGGGALQDARAWRAKKIPGSRLRAAAVLLVLAAAAAAFLQYGGAGTPPTGAWIVAPSVPEWLQMPDAMPGGAFAQVPDTTPPTFDSSELNSVTGALTITFSETIDATPTTQVNPTKIRIRESGTYTGGVTLTSGELGTDTDGATVSFTLTAQHNATVAGLTEPELTIEPGAVQDAAGNSIVGTFDTSTLTHVSATSIEDQETSPQGMAFSNDGLKMFVIGSFGDDVNAYNLTAAFDPSTLTAPVIVTSIKDDESNPHGMAFSNDGLKMFVIGQSGDDVNAYNLTAAFDTSMLTHVSATSIEYEETFPTGMAFSNDGLKMFVIGSFGDDVNEYSLTAAFDTSMLTHVSATSIEDEETFPTGMAFSNDGSKMFVIGSEGEEVNEYDLHSVYPVTVTDTPPLQDTTSPTIELVGDSPIEASHGSTYADQGATCTDNTDGPITPVLASNDVDTGSIGTYSVVYSCTDNAGNESTVTRTVRVVDDMPPVITLSGPDAVTITVNTSYIDAGAACQDTVDGPITPMSTSTVDTTQAGTYAVTYSCTDAADNPATPVSRTVNVVATSDLTPPVITLSGRCRRSR